eukprot:4766923-Amphidinium_carterae.2
MSKLLAFILRHLRHLNKFHAMRRMGHTGHHDRGVKRRQQTRSICHDDILEVMRSRYNTEKDPRCDGHQSSQGIYVCVRSKHTA